MAVKSLPTGTARPIDDFNGRLRSVLNGKPDILPPAPRERRKIRDIGPRKADAEPGGEPDAGGGEGNRADHE